MEDLLRPSEAAARLGVSPATLSNMRCRGVGPPYVRLSARCVRYRPSDLDAWIADRVRSNTRDQGVTQ